MKSSKPARRSWLPCGVALLGALLLPARRASAYIEATYSLGRTIAESTNILIVKVETVDKTKNTIIYRKVKDLKGTNPGDTIKHTIAHAGFNAREWQYVMQWAEPGQIALIFHNGSAAETCIQNYWYQMAAGGEWWSMNHGEPYLLRTYCGKPEKLATAVQQMLTGQEVLVPCMVDGDKMALQLRTAKVQRLKASLKIQDYDPKRDFAGWGVEEFRALAGMPAFSQYAPLSRVDPEAMGVAPCDFDADGKVDLCLYGAVRVALLQNGGGSMNDSPLPLAGGARSASWGDFDGDGKPDLLLATPAGPKLFRNKGGAFEDVSYYIPREPYWNVTAAAFIDHDGDGKPDLLLADGFRGLRLLRNKGVPKPDGAALTSFMDKWYYCGPFDNTGGQGFDKAYGPEANGGKVDLKAAYDGKGGQKAAWKEGKFADGEVNDLLLFQPAGNENACVYLYREITFITAAEVPVSLGSDDTLSVWLNGEKIVSENVSRGCLPDQTKAVLKLKAGKNRLLMKICQGSGGWGFYFKADTNAANATPPPIFDDVSDRVGLGGGGIAGALKGDRLCVADVDGDGKPDFLFSAGAGVLCKNVGGRFVQAADSGISYKAGGVSPVFGDLMGDGKPALFVPQSDKDGGCKLFRNDGKGRFSDVTAKAGLNKPLGRAVCAEWADFNKSGRQDLIIGCLKGPNRYFRNNGQGVFSDATEEAGFFQRIFNTRALAVVDVNKDGVLDVVMNNEGQEPAILVGNPARITVKPLASVGSR